MAADYQGVYHGSGIILVSNYKRKTWDYFQQQNLFSFCILFVISLVLIFPYNFVETIYYVKMLSL